MRPSLRDQRGFTLVETVIAMTVIFASLTTLAFTATASFRYQDVARQRLAADGVAAKVMEDIRGLPYDAVVAGLLSTDLSGDPNIVSCSGEFRFLSCTPGSEPGSGERIVRSPGLGVTVPLVPHRSNASPNTDPVLNGIAYRWSTYVSRDDSASSAPYRVTVVVTWTGGVGAPSKLVRIQSLFWSPLGCLGTATHPFAAPCQPSLLGNAVAPAGSLSVTGTIAGISVTGFELELNGASAGVQQEQLASAQASAHPLQGTVSLGGSSVAVGGATVSTNADGDPATGSAGYARQRCGVEVNCSGATLQQPSSGNTYVSLPVSTPTSGEAESAAAATASAPCPPSAISATAQTDSLPCAGAAVGTSTANTASVHLVPGGVGVLDVPIARVGTASLSQSTAWVDRVTFPAPAGSGCTPAASTDGCVFSRATRSYPAIRLGGLPSALVPPLLVGNCVDGGTFFLLSIVGYADTATAAAGNGAVAPTAAAPTGTISYYDAASGTCKQLSVSSASVNGLDSHLSTSQLLGGSLVGVSISTDVSATTAASQSTSSTGNPITQAQAEVVPPIITVRYSLTVLGATVLDLTATVNLGALTADAMYAPAPLP